MKEEVHDDEQPVFDINNVKAEPQEQESMQLDTDESAMDTGDTSSSSNAVHHGEFIVKEEPVGGTEENGGPEPGDIKAELIEAIGEEEEEGRTTGNLAYKVGLFFQRNATYFRLFNNLYQIPEGERAAVLVTESSVLGHVFQYLTTLELVACRSVCRAWQRVVARDYAVSLRVDLSGMKVTAHMVQVVAMKKPQHLVLDWTNVSKQQVFIHFKTACPCTYIRYGTVVIKSLIV